ncbi:MAG: type III-A CRISPR-associated protein Csm2 [Thermoanaerobacteraceae bacterium]|nr:type III-A CRISPR-associated protein Csm2 [Thermoanaerobacteraceae bacterium]
MTGNWPNDRKPRRGKETVVNKALKNVPLLLDKEKDPHGKLLVETAEALGEHLAKKTKMTTSQIRKLYSDVKRLKFKKENGSYRINLMRAKLAYIAGRHKDQVRDLQDVLDRALREIGTSEEKYQRFADFFEAIVAYHKKYGGQEG